MRQPLLLALLAIATVFYFVNSPSAPLSQTVPAGTPATVTSPVASAAVHHPAPVIVVASAGSYQNRWQSGETAQNDWTAGQTQWKTGPKAQTDIDPFPPSEQQNWNHSSGYSIVSGRVMRRR